MQCLIDYIGIRTCGSDAVPDSGMFINDFLPGVELKQIDQIADADQVNFVGVWRDVQARAAKKFVTDVIAAIQNRFNDNGNSKGYALKQITQSVDIGRKIDAATTFAALNEPRGGRIELHQAGESWVNSNMQVLHIQSLSVYFSQQHNFSVVVTDLDTGIALDTFAVTGVVGWNLINVNKNYSTKRISLTYNATGIISTSLDISQHYLNSFSNDFSGWYWDNCLCSNFSCGCAARVQGIKGNDVTDNTYGLSCVFSVKCTYDNLICNNKSHFAAAWAYCIGVELMTERIYTSRINRWTTVDKARAQELRKEFLVNYKGGDLDGIPQVGELQSAVYGLQLNTNDCCIECDAPIKFVNSSM